MSDKKLIYADDARRAILETDPKLAYCIERIKAVDAVEAVRCKDCIYRIFDDVCQEYYCNSAFGMSGEIKDNDFCSKGEREDNR